ncbi:MAG: ATP-binding protein, partial [bacterium]
CTLLVVRALDPATIHLERAVAPTHSLVAELATDVERVLQQASWPEEAIGATQLLVMEHGANVVDHAGIPSGSHISLQMRLSEQRAWLLFRDNGREWDFKERLVFSLRQPADSDRGRGLRIIRSIARHIDVVRRDRENAILYIVDRNFVVGPRTGGIRSRSNE